MKELGTPVEKSQKLSLEVGSGVFSELKDDCEKILGHHAVHLQCLESWLVNKSVRVYQELSSPLMCWMSVVILGNVI